MDRVRHVYLKDLQKTSLVFRLLFYHVKTILVFFYYTLKWINTP